MKRVIRVLEPVKLKPRGQPVPPHLLTVAVRVAGALADQNRHCERSQPLSPVSRIRIVPWMKGVCEADDRGGSERLGKLDTHPSTARETGEHERLMRESARHSILDAIANQSIPRFRVTAVAGRKGEAKHLKTSIFEPTGDQGGCGVFEPALVPRRKHQQHVGGQLGHPKRSTGISKDSLPTSR